MRHADSTYTFWAQTRKMLRTKRVWWRYRYVPGAPLPPGVCPHVRKCRPDSVCDCPLGAHYSWIHDIHAGFTNPPGRPRDHMSRM